MSQLSYMEKLLDGVEVKRLALGDIGEFIRGNGIQKKDLVEAGFPAVHYGQIFTRYGFSAVQPFTFISDELAKKSRIAQKNDLLIATTSENDEDVLKSVAWLGEKVAISGDMMLFRHDQNVKYLAYYFQTEDFQRQKIKFITGAKVRRVSRDNLAKMTVSFPSLDVQAEIVRILDVFTELTAELTAELVARRKQYTYYRDQLLTFEEDKVEWKDLGEVGAVRMCKRVLKSQTSDRKGIPFYKIGTFGKEPNAYITRELFDEYKAKYSYPKIGEVLISASGTIGRTVIFDGRDAYFQDSNIVWIENNENKVLNKYLFYFYQVVSWNVAEGGTIKRLYNDNLRKIKIPIPPLAEQKRIVTILDKFDALTTSLTEGLPREIELRQQQYEYYRELLLNFPKLEGNA